MVDVANIFLVVVSFGLAAWLPIEVFLFAYAFLGPLHYLTEISWLKERRFFTTTSSDSWVLAALCLLACVCSMGTVPLVHHYFGADGMLQRLTPFGAHAAFAALIWSVLSVYVPRWKWRAFLLVVVSDVLLVIQPGVRFQLAFGLLLPTMIHVIVFTGIFVLLGALRSRSRAGMVTFVAFVICAIAPFVFPMPISPYESDSAALSRLHESGFASLNLHLQSLFGDVSKTLASPLAVRLQVLIAFGYTYHYLNWFSKTKVIGWHKADWRQLIGVVVLWLVSVGIYWLDYALGVLVLLFLSYLHVFLELPLNVRSIVSVSTELRRIFVPSTAQAAR